MRGDIHHSPYMSQWRDTQLKKHRDNFTSHLYHILYVKVLLYITLEASCDFTSRRVKFREESKGFMCEPGRCLYSGTQVTHCSFKIFFIFEDINISEP